MPSNQENNSDDATVWESFLSVFKTRSTLSPKKEKVNFKLIDQSKLIIILIGFLVFLGLFYQSIFGPGLAGGGDLYNYQVAILNFIKNSFFSSQSILWNPYLGSGTAMTIFSPLFYPLSILYLITSTKIYLLIFYLIHFLITFLSTYALARSFDRSKSAAIIAAIIYSLNGFFAIRTYMGHIDLIAAASFLPLELLLINLFYQKKRAFFLLLLAIPFCLQILTGNLQLAYYSALVFGFYFVVHLFFTKRERRDFSIWKALLWFTITILLALGISSLTLLPTQLSTGYTTRALPLTFDIVASYSQPLKDIWLLFFPTPFLKGFTYEGIDFLGLIPLLLTIIGLVSFRRRWIVWFFFTLSLFALLISAGGETPLFRLFYYLLPGFASMRAHVRSLIVLVMAVSILSSFGFDSFMNRLQTLREKKFSKGSQIAYISIGIFLLILALIIKSSGQLLSQIFTNHFMFVYLSTFALLIIGLSFYLAKKVNRLFWQIFFAFILGFTFYKFDWAYVEPHQYTLPVSTDAEIAQAIKTLDSTNQYKIWHDINFEDDYQPRIFNFERFSAPEVLALGRNWLPKSYLQIRAQREAQPQDYVGLQYDLPFDKKILPLLGVKYVVSIKPNLEDSDLKLIKQFVVQKDFGQTGYAAYLYAFEKANPLFYFQNKVNETAIQEPKPENLITISHYQQNSVRLQVNNTQEGQFLVFGNLYFPGWSVKVNGQPQKIETINYGFMGVRLPSGSSTVEFNFKPLGWDLSVLLTFSLILILAILLFVTARRNNL